MKHDTVICLPARYQSTRLPGKPLIKIAGKELILWALQSASQITAKHILVATDDERIAQLVQKHGYEAIMTAKNHKTGTDRLAEVAEILQLSDDTIVVNYQADEPLTPKANIQQLIDALIHNPQADIATLFQPCQDFDELINPNNVKLITDNDGFALYFSRSALPYSQAFFEQQKLDDSITYKHHVGLYAYRAGFLKKFSKLQQTALEKTESLEQLRALSNGFKIIAKAAKEKMPHGIDTPEDLRKFQHQH